MNTIINPDSVILQQVDGHWQKLAALIVWKCVGRGTVTITAEDIQGCAAAFAPGPPTLLTHGHADSIEFRLVDEAAAKRLAEHDRTLRGRA